VCSSDLLDAGAAIMMTAPFGNRTLAKTSPGAGVTYYSATLDQTATTLLPGTYTFTGPGGADVGSFTATYAMPTPFVWTNQSSLNTIDRSAGVTVAWTGGDPAGYVTISGASTAYGSTAATTTTVGFTCTARVTDGNFTVPSIVLLNLPASAPAAGTTVVIPGSISLTHSSAGTSFKPPSGVDFASINSVFSYGGSVTYQ